MREFDPNDPLARRKIRDVEDDSAARFGVIGMFAVLTAAIVVGLFYWSKNERITTTMNAAPGVTTGASKTSPPPPAIPSGKDDSATR